MADVQLAHYRDYVKPYKAGKTGTFICFPLTVILIALTFLVQNPQLTAVLAITSIVCAVLCFTFLLFMFINGGNIKRAGTYEAMDIINNSIYYQSERTGLQVLTPEKIDRIKMKKKPKGPLYDIEIFLKDTGNSMVCPNSVTGYSELVEKIRTFARTNNLSLTR